MIRQLAYLPVWYFKAKVLKKRLPLQAVLFVTDRCNLRCKHCAQSNHAGTAMKTYDEVSAELDYAHGRGARFVDFEGGEPMLWRDGERAINDLIALAKRKGFFSATVTTNGQFPLDGIEADSVWVSVDGTPEIHDAIRGAGAFARLDANIRESPHKSISVNMAVNAINKGAVSETAGYAKSNPNIKSMSLSFHTPFPGVEDIALSNEERERVIDEALSLKKRGYPIMNSRSGLMAMKKREFKKDCWVSMFIMADGTKLRECPGSICGVCDDCGFCMAGETHCMLKLKPDTILSALKLRLT